jgi:hypothetical protein
MKRENMTFALQVKNLPTRHTGLDIRCVIATYFGAFRFGSMMKRNSSFDRGTGQWA